MTHLRSIVQGLKAEERQVEENLEGIQKATIAEMRVINSYLKKKYFLFERHLLFLAIIA